ncbi:MAG: sulfur carrier protein ThiS adenylyltransferase ThiF [Armatimonadetes bacterium]|nr:sulfur carrier protein ThiS adenylyltransferase ThiF [Armatimonadota bacterium]
MNEFEQALSRYLNQEQLDRIRSVKVGIAGAGGLGSNCATALVRTGFRNIRIADFDVVDHSNLNRQFYFMHQAGRTKVEALRENLVLINPAANIEIASVKLEADNVAELFADCDVVVEAFDRAEYKKLIVETYLGSGKLLVAASGLAGWGNSDRIKVHRVKDNFYLIGDLATGIGPDTPPLAPCVFIAAAKQADVVLSYALGTLQGGCAG